MATNKPFFISGKIVQDKKEGKWRRLRVSNGPAQWFAWLDTQRHAKNQEQVLNGGFIKLWVLKKFDPQGIEFNEVEQIILT